MIKPEKFYEALKLGIVWGSIFAGIAALGNIAVWINLAMIIFSLSLFVIPYKSDSIPRKIGGFILPLTVACTTVHIGIAFLRMIGIGTAIIIGIMFPLAVIWNILMAVDSKILKKFK